MRNNLAAIRAVLPSTGKVAEIILDNRNLIVTGVNGCGKTQFINALYEYMQGFVIHKVVETELSVSQAIQSYEFQLSGMTKADASYKHYFDQLNKYKLKLDLAKNPMVVFSDLKKYIIDVEERKAVLLKFEATRQVNIRASEGSKSIITLKRGLNPDVGSSEMFEEYLVSQKIAQAYAESPNMANKPDEARKISTWFDKLQTDLQELFEDASLFLRYDYESQAFYINQNGKSEYRFQQLSSGFSSILSIYTELLTKIQLGAATPDEIYGVVLIDEIDAHLHVTLQRKILAFLVSSFPCIQFIVTTHSPFVVSSVSEAVIYDLSSLEQVDDLSMYSYESILSGLFKTPPISEVLREKILELGKLLESSDPDVVQIERSVREIGEHEHVLDEESAYFLKKGRLLVNKSQSRRRDV